MSRLVRINVSIFGVANTPTAMVATAWVGDRILCATHGSSRTEALAGIHEQARYVRSLIARYQQQHQQGR